MPRHAPAPVEIGDSYSPAECQARSNSSRLRPAAHGAGRIAVLGLGHLQSEALITSARLSTNPNDFAFVALLGLLGLRIFEACGSNIADLGEEHGHRVLRLRGKGGKVMLVPLPPAVARAIDRAVDGRASGPILATPSARGGTGMLPPADSSTWPKPQGSGCRGCIPTCCATRS